ncbi:MAG: hypothetical protein ACFFBP_21975, partial [Promethearchaeota archaeon]
MSAMEIWIELMILQTIIGYCFVLANVFIGMYNISDLNLMKGDLSIVKYHKRFGWVEITIFYALFAQCMYMLTQHIAISDPYLVTPSSLWSHTWIGGLIATLLVTLKFIVARFKKDSIYKYGMYLGPIGFLGWSLSHWTSLYNFYFHSGIIPIIVPNSFIWAAIIPFFGGVGLFLLVLFKRGALIKEKTRFAFNQI